MANKEGPLFDNVFKDVKIVAVLMAGAKDPESCGVDEAGKVYILNEKGVPIKEASESIAGEVQAAIRRGDALAPR